MSIKDSLREQQINNSFLNDKEPIKYNHDKAEKAAIYLIEKTIKKEMDYYCLSKMLYYAERESFRMWETEFIGGIYKSLEHGPVHQSVLDSINNKHVFFKNKRTWHNVIQNNNTLTINKNLQLPEDFFDDFSEEELELLDRIYNETKDYDMSVWKKVSHAFEEYTEVGKNKSAPLKLTKMLDVLGISEEQQNHIVSLSKTINRFSVS